MVVDASGNRFASFADGSIGLLNSANNTNTNRVVVVEVCTNLANPIWTPLQTNTLPAGDPAEPNRFYRLRIP